MFYRTDNPLADFDNYEAARERELKKRPKCDYCGEHIQDDHCYEIDGELVCESCLEKHFYKWTEDYMEHE